MARKDMYNYRVDSFIAPLIININHNTDIYIFKYDEIWVSIVFALGLIASPFLSHYNLPAILINGTSSLHHSGLEFLQVFHIKPL